MAMVRELVNTRMRVSPEGTGKIGAMLMRGERGRGDVYAIMRCPEWLRVEGELNQALGLDAMEGLVGSFEGRVVVPRSAQSQSDWVQRLGARYFLEELMGLAGDQPAPEQARHTEARLHREMGQVPIMELHGLVKVRAGRVVGVWMGPHDMAEMLSVQGFATSLGSEEGTTRVGALNSIPFYLLDEDLP